MSGELHSRSGRVRERNVCTERDRERGREASEGGRSREREEVKWAERRRSGSGRSQYNYFLSSGYRTDSHYTVQCRAQAVVQEGKALRRAIG